MTSPPPGSASPHGEQHTPSDAGLYVVHVHSRHGRTREPFPERGRTREQVLARLADPPQWTNSVLVFDEDTRQQLVIAFVNRTTSKAEHRVALDLLVAPDAWRTALTQRPPQPPADGEEDGRVPDV